MFLSCRRAWHEKGAHVSGATFPDTARKVGRSKIDTQLKSNTVCATARIEPAYQRGMQGHLMMGGASPADRASCMASSFSKLNSPAKSSCLSSLPRNNPGSCSQYLGRNSFAKCCSQTQRSHQRGHPQCYQRKRGNHCCTSPPTRPVKFFRASSARAIVSAGERFRFPIIS